MVNDYVVLSQTLRMSDIENNLKLSYIIVQLHDEWNLSFNLDVTQESQ